MCVCVQIRVQAVLLRVFGEESRLAKVGPFGSQGPMVRT